MYRKLCEEQQKTRSNVESVPNNLQGLFYYVFLSFDFFTAISWMPHFFLWGWLCCACVSGICQGTYTSQTLFDVNFTSRFSFLFIDSSRNDLMVLFEGSQVIFWIILFMWPLWIDWFWSIPSCVFYLIFIGCLEESLWASIWASQKPWWRADKVEVVFSLIVYLVYLIV